MDHRRCQASGKFCRTTTRSHSRAHLLSRQSHSRPTQAYRPRTNAGGLPDERSRCLRAHQALLPKLRTSSIVLISSVAAGTGLPNHCAISAAKAGLEGFAGPRRRPCPRDPGQCGCPYAYPDRDGTRHGRGRKDDSYDRKQASPQKDSFCKGNCRYDLFSSFFFRRIHNGPSLQGGRRPFPSSNFMTLPFSKGLHEQNHRLVSQGFASAG